MGMRQLENAVLAGAKATFMNKGLKMKDILEWSTGDIKAQAGEVVARVDDPGVNVAIKKELDKRK